MIRTSIQKTVRDIALEIDGQVIGDDSFVINGISAIEDDVANTITFFGHPRYEKYVIGNSSRVVIVPNGFNVEDRKRTTFIWVEDVYAAVSKVSRIFSQKEKLKDHEISHLAIVEEGCEIGENVEIGHYTIVKQGARIGDGASIKEQVFIGANVHIGTKTTIYPGVRILRDVRIGSNCIIYPNAVIGGEGFGHAFSPAGYQKISHQASVIIEDDVEIGSNTCVDRGALKNTIIRKGAKLDNLIQVAHGVEIGENVAIAAQTGISGSSSIGSYSQIGGQVGIVGHVTIAPNSKIQAKSGVSSSIKKEGGKWYGYPLLSYYNYLRSYAIFKKLPDLASRLEKLEKEIMQGQ